MPSASSRSKSERLRAHSGPSDRTEWPGASRRVDFKAEAFKPARVVDEAGRVRHTLFTLERQRDGGWRIGACSVTEVSCRPT